MQQQNILATILDKIGLQNNSQRNFLQSLFLTILTIPSRVNFANLSRYMPFHRNTISTHYNRAINFAFFHQSSVDLVIESKDPESWSLAVDCSYIFKSGQHTWGADNYWSGSADSNKWGLEISLGALINVQTNARYAVEVIQTPGGLSAKEGQADDYTRVDHYVDQLRRLFQRYDWVRYLLADGYYMKQKILQVVDETRGKVLITKLRRNADLKFYLDRTKNPEAHGNKKYAAKYDSKDPLSQLDLWTYEGQVDRIKVYSALMYSPYYKRDLKVVLCVHDKLGCALLCSTDTTLRGKKIVRLYKSRFQIEFIFRDAKQYAGLADCQARDEQALNFHFNTSIATVNLARIEATLNKEQKVSFNNIKRSNYNQIVLKEFISQAGLELSSPEIQRAYEKTCEFGLMRA